MRKEYAGLYIRVSLDRTAHGMAEEILSPDTQEARGRAYCEAQGWQVGDVERDIDESGYRQHYSQRPGLIRLLLSVESGHLSKIVVWKFSRLSRRLKEFLEICDRVEAAGAGVVSVTEQIDTSTPAGRLIRNILASFAQFQSEELSEQISANWLTKVRRGERPAGQSPFGTINEMGILQPNPATHHHLIEMYRVFANTNSIKAVYQYLVDNGVPPPVSHQWNLNTIRLILRNPVYTGHLAWLGEVYEARWTPLVPLDIWEKAQTHFERRRMDRKEVPRRGARILSGVTKCNCCNRTMWIKFRDLTARSASASDRVYQCLAPQNMGKGCDIPTLDAGEAERAVWEAVQMLLAGLDIQPLIEHSAREQARLSKAADSARTTLLARRERTERATAQLLDLLVEGSITRDQFRRKNQEYLQRLETIDTQLAAVPPLPAAVDSETLRTAARMALPAATAAEKRALLLALGAQVVVTERAVYLDMLGLRIRLRTRLLGDVFHIGDHYHRLDYRGPVLTDKQKRFLHRTYTWAKKAKLAARLGRSYRTLVTRARALGIAPLRPGG